MTDRKTNDETAQAEAPVQEPTAAPESTPSSASDSGEPAGPEGQAPDDGADPRGFKVHDRRHWAQEAEADGQASGEAPGNGAAKSSKPTYIEQLEEELAKRDSLLKEYIEAHKAAEGRFEASRARLARELENEIARAKADLVSRFFEVLDNLDRSVEASERTKSFDALRDGVRIVQSQFLGRLETLGLTRIEPLGEPFDPHMHEAVSVARAADPAADNTVQTVLRVGYRQGDTVLRPAMVIVARH